MSLIRNDSHENNQLLGYLLVMKGKFRPRYTRCRYNNLPSGLPLCVIPISPEGLSSFPINFMISIFMKQDNDKEKD